MGVGLKQLWDKEKGKANCRVEQETRKGLLFIHKFSERVEDDFHGQKQIKQINPRKQKKNYMYNSSDTSATEMLYLIVNCKSL